MPERRGWRPSQQGGPRGRAGRSRGVALRQPDALGCHAVQGRECECRYCRSCRGRRMPRSSATITTKFGGRSEPRRRPAKQQRWPSPAPRSAGPSDSAERPRRRRADKLRRILAHAAIPAGPGIASPCRFPARQAAVTAPPRTEIRTPNALCTSSLMARHAALVRLDFDLGLVHRAVASHGDAELRPARRAPHGFLDGRRMQVDAPQEHHLVDPPQDAAFQQQALLQAPRGADQVSGPVANHGACPAAEVRDDQLAGLALVRPALRSPLRSTSAMNSRSLTNTPRPSGQGIP